MAKPPVPGGKATHHKFRNPYVPNNIPSDVDINNPYIGSIIKKKGTKLLTYDALLTILETKPPDSKTDLYYSKFLNGKKVVIFGKQEPKLTNITEFNDYDYEVGKSVVIQIPNAPPRGFKYPLDNYKVSSGLRDPFNGQYEGHEPYADDF